MKTQNRNFMSKIVGLCLGGLIGFTSFCGLSVKAECHEHEQTNIAVSERDNSEQYYRTKTGKCYHKENCKCLSESKIEVDDDEIQKADLKPCTKCCK